MYFHLDFSKFSSKLIYTANGLNHPLNIFILFLIINKYILNPDLKPKK